MSKKAVRPADEPVSEALAPVAEHPMAIIERVAKDPLVDVEKLGRLIELQKDMMRVQAKVDFDQAFAVMAPQLPTIRKGGAITNRDKSVRSKYARLGEDIHPVVKPVLEEHGFAIRHRTEWPVAGVVRVVGILSHRSGHSEESAFEAPADTSDYRTHVQSLGSTVSYGRRYTTIDLLNLTVHGADDDGQKGAPTAKPESRRRDEPKPVPAEQRTTNAAENEPITPQQLSKMAGVINTSARSDDEVDTWLRGLYGAKLAKPREAVPRKHFDKICAAIEAPGKLPAKKS